ncbi:MAG: TonB-dependent receptor [Burkholderiales bacterium]
MNGRSPFLRVMARGVYSPVACLAICACATAANAADNSAAPFEMPEIAVVTTTPVGGTGIALDKYPGNVQTLNYKDIPQDSRTLADMLNQVGGSMSVNNTQGNPYQVDLSYRGFTASPVLGTPQGISVFLDGMRVNEPFGDLVAWDLIPQIAIANVTVVPGSNPVYGLNTLGGAVSLNTKSGFAFPSGEVKPTLGSFGRRSVDAEKGGHGENVDYYVATSLYDDRGYAAYNPSKIRQFFGKLGYQNVRTDLDLSLMYADNRMNGNQNVPLSTLGNAAQGYSHPDYTNTQSLAINLRGSLVLNAQNSVAGNLYYRHIARDVFNSNIGNPVATSTNDASCVTTADCPASNLLADYTQNIFGGNLQWSNNGKLWGKAQVVTVGLNAEHGRTAFNNNGQNAFVDNSSATIGADAFMPQATIRSTNRRYAIFATDTLDATEKLSVNASARYDYAAIGLSGTSCTDANGLCNSAAVISAVPGANTLTDVSGSHSYRRLNPSVGLAYQLTPGLNGFGSYAEGFRTPSAIELACADPNSPCTGVPNAFGADPNLKAVVSKTWEGGFRGRVSDRLRWRIAAFRSTLHDDILFNQTNATQGYFSNVGQTRRQGVELGMDGKTNRADYALSVSWVDATFQSPFTLANGSNSTCIAAIGAGGGCAGVNAQPGDKIPGIPAVTLKLRVGYAVTPRSRVKATVQAQGPQYARGDENNQDANGRVPGFATVKLDINHRFEKNFEVFGGVTNLFNTKYSTFGTLGPNNLASGSAEQFRGVASPRAVYAGLRAFF